MSLPKAYEPGKYEEYIYSLWEKNGAFKPQNSDGEGYFSVVAPPPNANANLHIGYGLTMAVEDISVRYNRLKGKSTLFVPGADHAGFETWVVYEKKLNAEGKSRFDFNREELYRQVWDFVASNREVFEKQFRRLGASVDWDHFTFTLDDKVVKQAYSTFKKMWDEGLIYRGERLVNYCTYHGTSFADIEVEYEEATSPLYYMKYGPFVLATTRPETKFGDTAVAVHPDDNRYKKWVGKVVTVEGVNGPFDVQVIADTMVDPKFGTGVVKITPAHSFDDWEVAQRHNLPPVRVINHDGTMNEKTGPFRGMTVLEAREAVIKALAQKDLLVKVDDNYKNRVGKCYKCGTIIEPMLMEQWFIDMQPLVKPAIEALNAKKITFYPDSKREQLINYLNNLRDWNISRQIAWGIPIPAFQNVDDPDDWIFDDRVGQELIEVESKNYRRDPDVFDTWFSSSSWPYATLNYPDGHDFKNFYPLSLMETGGEILYPWVSRMLMLGLYVTGKIPFKEVYIHGYVMAEDGAKMSKSLGNVIDLTEVIDKYGSDALRMGIIAGRSPAVNRGYDSRRVEEARNFANKMWNIARFTESKCTSDFQLPDTPTPEIPADFWILHCLSKTAKEMSDYLENYRFSEAYETLYHFVWNDLADWYVEANKKRTNNSVLGYTLAGMLKIAHPYAPFVTEAIWQNLGWKKNMLATENWPEVSIKSTRYPAARFQKAIEVIEAARRVVKALGLEKPNLVYQNVDYVAESSELIAQLAGLGEVTEGGQGMRLPGIDDDIWLDIDKPTARKYLDKLNSEKQAREVTVKLLKSRLSNDNYLSKAPKELVDQTKLKLAEEIALLDSLNSEIKLLGKS